MLPFLKFWKNAFSVCLLDVLRGKAQRERGSFAARPFKTNGERFSAAHNGFGVALLTVFVLSSLLLAASLSLLLGPGSATTLGPLARDGAITQQIALIGLEAAQNDILSQLEDGTTITTSYRYPASSTNSVSIPTYPNSGVNNTVGNYYVTVTKARGYTYMLQATATVNSNVTTVTRLVQLHKSPGVPSNAMAAYSLRKVFSDYSGSAVNVRCTSTGLTQDIGFDSNGNFDVAALRTCLGDSTLPLDLVSGAKLAYGLRKLSSSYSGYAIKVRRNSDNTTKDIGFTANGSLDVATLLSFTGSNSAYVTTWYDQSGNGKNLTQATSGYQPRIVLNGSLDTINNAPAIKFSGGSTYLGNTSISGLISGADAYAFVVAQQDATATSGLYNRFVTLHKSNSSGQEDWQVSGGWEILCTDDDARNIITEIITKSAGGSVHRVTSGVPFQTTTYVNSANKLGMYVNGTLAEQNSTGGATLNPNQVYVGIAGYDTGTGGVALTGKVSEFIFFNSSVSAANRAAIERSEGHYYNVTGMADGFVTTWYDQSGNGRNITQATTTNQPTINLSLNMPGVYFDSSQPDFLDNTALSITTNKLTAFGVGQVSSSTGAPANSRLVSVWKTGETYDWNNDYSSPLIMKINTNIASTRHSNDLTGTPSLTFGNDFQATTIFDGSTRYLRHKAVGATAGSTSIADTAGNLIINNLRVGASLDYPSYERWLGNIYEVVIYPTNLNAAQYQAFETNERTAYGI